MINWVARITGDPNFEIIPNMGGGDCLFYAVSQATGLSIEKLRLEAALRISDEEFKIKKTIYQSAKEEFEREKQLQTKRTYLNDVLSYHWMENINTVEQYRHILAKRGLWSDAETIGHIEKALQCKILLLSSGSPGLAYRNQTDDDETPNYYLIIGHSAETCHFELVTHDGNKQFHRETLPFIIRVLFAIR